LGYSTVETILTRDNEAVVLLRNSGSAGHFFSLLYNMYARDNSTKRYGLIYTMKTRADRPKREGFGEQDMNYVQTKHFLFGG
jgi:hypothetical protein